MKKNKLIIMYLFLFLSLFMDISFIPKIFNINYYYIIKPLYWSFIFIILIYFFKNEYIVNKKYKEITVYSVILSMLFYYLIFIWIGFINGFAYNPYDISFKGLLLNLWTIIPLLLSREYIRFYIINNCKKKNLLWIILLTSIIFVLVEVNMFKYNIYFKDSLSTLKFIMELFIPNMILHLFLSYINYYAGYFVSLLYALIPQLILFTIPILPNIDASLLSIMNSTFCFITYIFINFQINKIDKTINKKEYKKFDLKSVIILFSFIVLMCCFGMGVFSYQPLVIASNSMYPMIHKGDIVIIKDTKFKDVKKGEIIRYKLDDYYVVHRVENIIYQDGIKQLITKGDNNKNIDMYSVKEKQFEGTIKYKISYLGWPTIFMNELFNSSDNVIIEKGVEISEK